MNEERSPNRERIVSDYPWLGGAPISSKIAHMDVQTSVQR